MTNSAEVKRPHNLRLWGRFFLADRGNGAPSCRALQVGLTEAPVWEPSAAMRRSPYLGIGAVRLGQADSKRAFNKRGKA